MRKKIKLCFDTKNQSFYTKSQKVWGNKEKSNQASFTAFSFEKLRNYQFKLLFLKLMYIVYFNVWLIISRHFASTDVIKSVTNITLYQGS